MKVVGKRIVDYVSRKTGKPVCGINIYVTYKEDGVVGDVAESFFVSKNCVSYNSIASLPLGSVVKPVYNRYGNVEDFIVKDK